MGGPGAACQELRVLLGGLLELLLVVVVVVVVTGTAVTLYPVVKKQNPRGALGYAAGPAAGSQPGR